MRRATRAVAILVLTAAVVLGGHTAAQADVDDFGYDSWDAEYSIGTDEHGGAVAQVTETLVAQFPDFDQNRGIVRALPLRFAGAPAAPENVSVTDAHGAPVPFWIEEDDTFRAIMVGDDSFVHGEQTYVIEYTLENVIFTVDDGTHDEFYWDLVPVERAQPIAEFTARIAFASELASELTGTATCYTGRAYEDIRCDVSNSGDSGDSGESGDTWVIGPIELAPYEGATIAIGLEAGSVTQPSERLPNPLLDWGPQVFGTAGVLAAIGAITAQIMLARRRRRDTGIVIAHYEVPAELPPLIAAPIVGSRRSVIAAQIVHLAVNGAVRIEDGEAPTGVTKRRTPRPSLRLLDTDASQHPFDELDHRALRALFGSSDAGSVFTVPASSETFSSKMRTLAAAGTTAAKTRGYTQMSRAKASPVLSVIAIALAAVAVVVSVFGMSRDTPAPALGIMLGIVAIILAIFGLVKFSMHTPHGARTREYLLGVREFIRVAEADRLRMLQSYSGAERRADGTVDVVVLYERLLPYAVLFGLEREWGRVLEVTYHDNNVSTPVWYPGLAIAGISSLNSSLGTFTSALTSSASYTASSSGGSSGGGFSGGGGGGGFSGGR